MVHHADGNADIVVHYHVGTNCCTQRVDNGTMKLAQLRKEIYDIFQTVGNMHWATVMDIGMLSKALRIGFIIFPDRKQGAQNSAKGCVYGFHFAGHVFPYWLTLYNQRDLHFQVLETAPRMGHTIFFRMRI